MAEYIEREAALEECDWYANEFCECEYAIMPLKGALENLPAADVRPVVRGKWKPVMCAGNPNIQDRDEWYGALFVCDKCNWTMIGETNFCPNCGAMMEES